MASDSDGNDTSAGSGGMGSAGAPEGGGNAGASVVLNVRCFDYNGYIVCFGTPGSDNWAVVWPECHIALYETDPEIERAGNPAAANCDGLSGVPDSLTGWDDVACFRHLSSRFVECFGKLGEHWLEIFPDCFWASRTTYVGDPAEIACGTASVDRGGWDELRCFDPATDPNGTRCSGRRGAYWVGPTALAHYTNGLYPTCRLGEGGIPVPSLESSACNR